MEKLTPEEVKGIFAERHPIPSDLRREYATSSYRFDFCSDPVFVDGRQDMAVVVRHVDSGGKYNFDTIYVVVKIVDGKIFTHEWFSRRNHGSKGLYKILSARIVSDKKEEKELEIEYTPTSVWRDSGDSSRERIRIPLWRICAC